MPTDTAIAATATDLVKTYGTGDGAVRALVGVSAAFARGRLTARSTVTAAVRVLGGVR